MPSTNLVLNSTLALLNMPSLSDTTMNCRGRTVCQQSVSARGPITNTPTDGGAIPRASVTLLAVKPILALTKTAITKRLSERNRIDYGVKHTPNDAAALVKYRSFKFPEQKRTRQRPGTGGSGSPGVCLFAGMEVRRRCGAVYGSSTAKRHLQTAIAE